MRLDECLQKPVVEFYQSESPRGQRLAENFHHIFQEPPRCYPLLSSVVEVYQAAKGKHPIVSHLYDRTIRFPGSKG